MIIWLYDSQQYYLNSLSKIISEVGDYVKVDDIIALIETDKVTVDLRSADAGVITKLYAN
jgi:2-oxoglutarate dehydrogenase E2 component (dihydrolipoamide succinyltransferase)